MPARELRPLSKTFDPGVNTLETPRHVEPAAIKVRRDDRKVLFNTGAAQKYPRSADSTSCDATRPVNYVRPA